MNARFSLSLRCIACLLLVVPAIVRVCVLISPDPYFAFNPLELSIPADGLGPSGALCLDGCTLVGFLLTLFVSWRSKDGIDLKLVWMGMIPLAALAWHVFHLPQPFATLPDSAITHSASVWQIKDHANLFLGSAWMSAVLTAVGAAHLARDFRLRILMVGSVVAIIAPLAVKGFYQITVEHQITVDEFERSKDAIFRAQGWASDSLQARMYERRLEQAEATGWFGLSNVFGTLAAGLVAFWLTTTLAAAKSRLSSGWIGLLGIITAISMATLAITFSKGAIAVGLIGVVLSFGVLMPRRYRKRIMPLTPWITIGLIFATLVGVVFRGAVLGESFTADGYSLLFRWQYWQGALRGFFIEPFFGVGPEGFKAAYLITKPILSPEEVASPHSVFVSWLASMGVFSLIWFLLMALLMYRMSPVRSLAVLAKHSAVDETQTVEYSALDSAITPATSTSSRPFMLLMSALIGFMSLGLSGWINRQTSYVDFAYLLWPVAMGGYVLLMMIIPWLGRHASWLFLRWAVWCMLVVILVHSQIEMAMTRVGSASALFLLLGAAGIPLRFGGVDSTTAATKRFVMSPRLRRHFGAITLVIVSIFTGLYILVVWSPVNQYQKQLQQQSAKLGAVGFARQLLNHVVQSPTPAVFFERIDTLNTHLKEQEADPNVDGRIRELRSLQTSGDLQAIAQVQRAIVVDLNFAIKKLELHQIGGGKSDSASDQNENALQGLTRAHQDQPFDPIAVEEVARLWIHLARAHEQGKDVAAMTDAIDQACDVLESFLQYRPDRALHWGRAAQARKERYDMLHDATDLTQAIEFALHAATLDPHGIQSSQRVARLLDESSDRNSDAVEWYQRVLEINTQLRLDPLKQLTDQERIGIEQRIKELSSR